MLTDRLQAAIRADPAKWTLTFVGEDEYALLGFLKRDLQGSYSDRGDGKRIRSGYAYWGSAPSVAWKKACLDPTYYVMQAGTQSFRGRFQSLSADLGHFRNYVSLGVGTGVKDAILLSLLVQESFSYFPVDMSQQMLRIGVKEVLLQHPGLGAVLPVQLDFSSDENAGVLRRLLNGITEGKPILFSLLGNTLSNFEHDLELLLCLRNLLAEDDILLLEVATTPVCTDAAASEAASEYRGSGSFTQFALRTLLSYTDIRLDSTDIIVTGEVEGSKAIKVKCFWQNRTDTICKLSFADYDSLPFEPGDTIRLYLSRKYSTEGLGDLLRRAGLSVVREVNFRLGAPNRFGFGLALMSVRACEIPESEQGETDMSEPILLASIASALAAIKDAPGALETIRSLKINLHALEGHKPAKEPVVNDSPLAIMAEGLAKELNGLSRRFVEENDSLDTAEREDQRRRLAAQALSLIDNAGVIIADEIGADQVDKLKVLFVRFARK